MKKAVSLLAALVLMSVSPAESISLPSTAASTEEYTTVTRLMMTFHEYSDHLVLAGCDTSRTGSVTIPASLNGKPVTEIGDNAFKNCEGITGVNIPTSVEVIGSYAFYECTALESAVLPEGLKEIGLRAFRGCSSLKSVVFPSTLTSIYRSFEYSGVETVHINAALTDLRNSFDDCKLKKITVDEESKSYTVDNNALFNKDKTTLYYYLYGQTATTYTVPDTVKEIDDDAFSGSTLKKIVLPEGVTEIGSYAFAYNNALVSVNIPSTVTSMGFGVFSQCSSLKTAELPAGLKDLYSAVFWKCDSLTELTIPAGCKTVGQGAIKDCANLKTVTFLSPTCEIYDEADTICNTWGATECTFSGTIRGYSVSTAHDYAEKYGYAFEALDSYVLGDVNSDGFIDGRDASMVLAVYADSSSSSYTPDEKDYALCDVNSDKFIDGRDATVILSYYADLSSGKNIGFTEYLENFK